MKKGTPAKVPGTGTEAEEKKSSPTTTLWCLILEEMSSTHHGMERNVLGSGFYKLPTSIFSNIPHRERSFERISNIPTLSEAGIEWEIIFFTFALLYLFIPQQKGEQKALVKIFIEKRNLTPCLVCKR